MPVLDALPHLNIILGLKGILDFYYWKGIPCVRKWPHTPYSRRSAPSLASARLFGAIVAAYALLGAALKALFAEDAKDQTRTARDLFVSAVLGHLHDHNMSDFLDLLTEAVAALNLLTDLRNALNDIGTDALQAYPAYDGAAWQALLVDAQRHLQADILSSTLPTGAANATNQATMITALQLIDDLRAALASVDTDALQVRGTDQLYSYQTRLGKYNDGLISGPSGYFDSTTPGFGNIWIVTNVLALDITNPTTRHGYALRTATHNYEFYSQLQAFATGHRSCWSGHVYVDSTEKIRVYFTGALAPDICRLHLTGAIMTIET